MAAPTSEAPPAYARTVYDETHRGVWHMEPSIQSMANSVNLIGYLDHHSPDTDGSFGICLAGGVGNVVSQELIDSIPAAHRPVVKTDDAGQTIPYIMGQPFKAIGTTFFPIVLTNAQTQEHIRLVLHAFMVPKLLMGMFIGKGTATFLKIEAWSGGRPRFTFDFSGGLGEIEVQGV
ncbi:uncharacterized protein LACBIDRAFT_305211 [Laccaria bicolor S238N-H82]|uniref:Predicted protein n=1 Tax=Laccaria bicolor (strain S238N-H82 / ATCC MYA-4686) TaxID=486041 RepID=B0CTP4_LACBS|nr:uncharacterized protein LACBIDRAFT_305211 [Laccaria bicolor S238N-H82]EDR14529.1 predicted protein [Laccaria bicolor S238N-H82]|eukprot:XP_001875088.1 predicted protein [Laccaria bicolor S238N-H82]